MQEQEIQLGCSTFETKNDCRVWQRKQECAKDCPYIEGNLQKAAALPSSSRDRRKIARAFQRMLTGLHIAKQQGIHAIHDTNKRATSEKKDNEKLRSP